MALLFLLVSDAECYVWRLLCVEVPATGTISFLPSWDIPTPVPILVHTLCFYA